MRVGCGGGEEGGEGEGEAEGEGEGEVQEILFIQAEIKRKRVRYTNKSVHRYIALLREISTEAR